MHVGITNPRWWEKRPRRSQRMRNPQLYVSGKGPIASRRVIGLTTHPLPIERLIGLRENPRTCIVMLRSGRQQSKYGDVDDLSRATCHVYGGKFDIKMQSKRYEKVCPFKGLKSLGMYDSSCLIPYFFIKLGFPKLHFYPKLLWIHSDLAQNRSGYDRGGIYFINQNFMEQKHINWNTHPKKIFYKIFKYMVSWIALKHSHLR